MSRSRCSSLEVDPTNVAPSLHRRVQAEANAKTRDLAAKTSRSHFLILPGAVERQRTVSFQHECEDVEYCEPAG